VIFRVLKVFRHQTEQVVGETGRPSLFKFTIEAAPFRNSHGRVCDRFGRKSVSLAIFKPKKITRQVKCIDLTAAI
jgi:hypothetical protein